MGVQRGLKKASGVSLYLSEAPKTMLSTLLSTFSIIFTGHAFPLQRTSGVSLLISAIPKSISIIPESMDSTLIFVVFKLSFDGTPFAICFNVPKTKDFKLKSVAFRSSSPTPPPREQRVHLNGKTLGKWLHYTFPAWWNIAVIASPKIYMGAVKREVLTCISQGKSKQL